MTGTCLETRLEALNFLQQADYALLEELLQRRETAEPGELVVLENQKLARTRVIIDGWAYRYRSLSDGSRQILNFLIPGDIVGFFAIMLARSDCGVEALTKMEFAHFPAAGLVEALGTSPNLILTLSWIAGQSERVLDEQITRLGRRSAKMRMAHLFVELHLRLRRSGFENDDACVLPLTQPVLADALGMSSVHANRSFRALVKDRMVTRDEGNIRLLDVQGLARACDFDRTYLDHSTVPTATRSAVRDKLKNP